MPLENMLNGDLVEPTNIEHPSIDDVNYKQFPVDMADDNVATISSWLLAAECVDRIVQQELDTALSITSLKSNTSDVAIDSKEYNSVTLTAGLNDSLQANGLAADLTAPTFGGDLLNSGVSKSPIIDDDFVELSARLSSMKMIPPRLLLNSTKPLPDDLLKQNEFFLLSVKEVMAGIHQGSFTTDKELSVLKSQFSAIHQRSGLPLYLCSSLWLYFNEDWVKDGSLDRNLRLVKTKRLSFERFKMKWNDLINRFQDDEYALVYEVLKGGRPGLRALSAESFELIAEDVVMNHRELQFLQGNAIFQRRYIETVITRIFYTICRTMPPLEDDVVSGKTKGMTLLEFRKSRFVDLIRGLPDGEINDEREFFSYKHFFVLYCKFFDLDTENTMRIDSMQLNHYANCAPNPIICQRVTNGAGLPPSWRSSKNGFYNLQPYFYGASSLRREADSAIDLGGTSDEEKDDLSPRAVGQLTYIEFLWFILSEEDRTSRTAIEYWFRVLDLDDDGIISLYELEQLWVLQESRLNQEGCNAFDFKDIICVALDLMKIDTSSLSMAPLKSFSDAPLETEPRVWIRSGDLKRMPALSARFFDFFVNYQKLLERESTNGNRLIREIDELQQIFFQQQQFLAFKSDSSLSLTIPSDKKSALSRWADHEYDQYILQEELDQRRQREQQQQQFSHAHNIYSSIQDESGAWSNFDPDQHIISTSRKTGRVRRGRLKTRRTRVTKSTSLTKSTKSTNDPCDETLGEDEFNDEDEYVDVDEEDETSSDEEDDRNTTLHQKESMFTELTEECVEQLKEAIERFTGTAAEEEDRPVPKMCWTNAQLEGPANLFLQPVQPFGTVMNEHPSHVPRLQTSPPRSPNGNYGGRKAMRPTQVESVELVEIEDID